ncbi:hypothetical protein GCK72_002511 [Caenorhabditis remanei]|uniref:Uncharacterized protein n=2 Tax=Caenorhabditis remanei TaxID=31234 RepID=A0A6A5HR49_CAERE|nr:hypothetical protein GCK72_002511 [Caenorhabditis remanei]KAF1770690.1 hypothetical protein GCK72_002511 [Caenorhabditis remanei]
MKHEQPLTFCPFGLPSLPVLSGTSQNLHHNMSGKLEIISLEEFDEPFEEILKSEAEEAEKYADKWSGNSIDTWETVSSVGVNVSYSNYQF